MVGDKQADEPEPIDAVRDKFTSSQDRSVNLACVLACFKSDAVSVKRALLRY